MVGIEYKWEDMDKLQSGLNFTADKITKNKKNEKVVPQNIGPQN